jgi:hypothetical protein
MKVRNKIMRKVIRWVADDGTVFDIEEACRDYEQGTDYRLISQYLRIFDRRGNPAKWGTPWYHIGYVQVIKPFDEMTETEVSAWERIWDCELDDAICGCGEGWYFQGDDDRWHYWTQYAKDFYAIEAEMSKLIGNDD